MPREGEAHAQMTVSVIFVDRISQHRIGQEMPENVPDSLRESSGSADPVPAGAAATDPCQLSGIRTDRGRGRQSIINSAEENHRMRAECGISGQIYCIYHHIGGVFIF